MPYMAGNQEYLNQQEAIEFTGVAFATFKSLVKRLNVQKYNFPTRPKEIFYLRADLEKIMGTPEPVKPE